MKISARLGSAGRPLQSRLIVLLAATTAAFGIAPLARRILSGENPGAATRDTSREAGQETLEQQEREADALMRAHP